MKRVLRVLVSMSLMTGCGPQKETEEPGGDEKRGNPLYKGSASSGQNPLHKSIHLTVDNNGKPVIVYAQKVVEKATSGLKDTLKTNVRVIRPDTEGSDSATELAPNATPRAIGTVREDVHLIIEGDDGALTSALLGESTKTTALPGFVSLGATHQTVASIKGLPFVALKAVGGEFDGQSLLVELNNTTPNTFAIGKSLSQNDVNFIATGGENHREFAVAFAKMTVHSAVSQGNQLTPALDSGKTGTALEVWTDGKATKTIIDTADGVVVFDGKDSIALGAKTDALCRAGGFSVDGAPTLLTVTSTDTTIVTGDKTVLTTPTTDYAAGDLIDCTVVATAGVHGAWRIVRAPTDDARIDLDVIDYVNVSADGARLKTRHETAKNSISNVR